MASPQRSSKDLKTKLTDTKQDVEDVHRALEKLRCLSKDDKSEAGMLRSRIDEQSSLICILKQRADEMLCRCQALESINSELEAHRADVYAELEGERKKSSYLEKRFMDLASNHQAMIIFKDEYKTQNTKLRQENEQIREENNTLFSQELEEKEAVILKLTTDMDTLVEEHRILQNKYQDTCDGIQATHQELTGRHQSKETSLSNQLRDVQRQLTDAADMCTELNQQLQKARETYSLKETEMKETVESLVKEKDTLLNLSIQRGKQIQDKQEEVLLVEARRKEEESGRVAAEKRFEREAASVTANLKVKALQHRLDQSVQTCNQLRKDFEAFKEHSNDMLTKEKDLNAKLRHIIG
ncbi:coiled-coil domain-containing protein 89 isoform X2 [Osmerus eperlanus]|uniref:coiled-coil domain-containing protein 89 isoform X2 n=1 Tax=Osmerus eperlanus TaxID=29151 RepID=UPI002E1111B5